MALKYFIAILVTLTLTTAASALTVIDNFEEVGTSPAQGRASDPGVLGIGPGPSIITIDETEYMTGIDPLKTVGGTRYMEVDLVSPNPGTEDDAVKGTIITTTGVAQFDSPTGSTGDFFLRYGVDSSGNPTAAEQLDSDFNVGGAAPFQRIETKLTADQPGSLTVTLVEDVDGANIQASTTINFLGNAGVEQFVNFQRALFVADNPLITFSDIDAVLVQLDGSNSGDYDLSLIAAIPEPTTASLLALGAIGLMRRRRRRNA